MVSERNGRRLIVGDDWNLYSTDDKNPYRSLSSMLSCLLRASGRHPGCMARRISLRNPLLVPFRNRRGTMKGENNPHVGCGGRMLEIAGHSSFSPLALQALPQTSTVQERNRTTGTAMSILMKCDAETRLSASRNKSRHSFKPAGQADRANPSVIKPDGPRASRPTFVEDFTREHSLLGLHITSIEISGIF